MIVPNTDGLHGLEAAAAAGIIAGDPDKKLLVISQVSDEEKARIATYLQEADFRVTESENDSLFDICITLERGEHKGYCRISGSHTNIVRIDCDGHMVFDREETADAQQNPDKAMLKVEDIVAFADAVNLEDVKPVLDRQIRCNMDIAREGIEKPYGARIGQVLMATRGDDIVTRAKAFGLRVITTVRGAAKAEAIRDLGADVIVDTSKESLAAVLKAQLEQGYGVDVAIDCLGGADMGESLHYLNRGARWIMIAALAGTKTEIDLKNIYVRNVRIIGSTLRSRAPEVKAQILTDLVKNVWAKVESGEVKPTIYKVLPIQEAEAAHDILYKGQNVGKVVLTVN